MDNETLSLSTSPLVSTANGVHRSPTTTARDNPRPKWATTPAKRIVTVANVATCTAATAGRVQSEVNRPGTTFPTAPSVAW